MRCTVDTSDRRAIARVRRAIVEEIGPHIASADDRFAVEVIAGEVLAAELEHGGTSVVVEASAGPTGATMQIWDQSPAMNVDDDPIRKAILSALESVIQIERSQGGSHIVVRLPFREKGRLLHGHRIWQLASALVFERTSALECRIRETMQPNSSSARRSGKP